MFVRSIAFVTLLLLVGCIDTERPIIRMCLKAQAAEEVYEACMLDPDCQMGGIDRENYIQQKTNWLTYKCEGRLSQEN